MSFVIYYKCKHLKIEDDGYLEDITRMEYCPDCHRKMMLAEIDQIERVERERCVCCGSYVGGNLCEQP